MEEMMSNSVAEPQKHPSIDNLSRGTKAAKSWLAHSCKITSPWIHKISSTKQIFSNVLPLTGVKGGNKFTQTTDNQKLVLMSTAPIHSQEWCFDSWEMGRTLISGRKKKHKKLSFSEIYMSFWEAVFMHNLHFMSCPFYHHTLEV